MRNVYNKVEWSYLEKVMVSMEFKQQLISLIMASVSTKTFSVLLMEPLEVI